MKNLSFAHDHNPPEHGGNLHAGIAQFGGERENWIDLSTGINPYSYPFVLPAPHVFSSLPAAADIEKLEKAAQHYYNSAAACLAVSGAQSAIQLLAQYLSASHQQVHILGPTYNEYKRCFAQAGMKVSETSDISISVPADIAIICSPNNPTGEQFELSEILHHAQHAATIIIDESFAESMSGPSLTSQLSAQTKNIFILRSFGKFFGLAGLRLGFIFGPTQHISALRSLAGPWTISGIALDIAYQAFKDRPWSVQTLKTLHHLAKHCDMMAVQAGWKMVGGCALFRLYETPNAKQAHEWLASHHIWTRHFSYHSKWLRLGIPHADQIARVKDVFSKMPSLK